MSVEGIVNQIALSVGWFLIHPLALNKKQTEMTICYQFRWTDCLTYAEEMDLLFVSSDIPICWSHGAP